MIIAPDIVVDLVVASFGVEWRIDVAKINRLVFDLLA